jgi:hypothetical protein
MKLIFLVFSIILSSDFVLPTPEIGLSGHMFGVTDHAYNTLAVFGDGSLLDKSKLENNGDFMINFSDSRQKYFDFYLFSDMGDILLVASIKSFETDEPKVAFYIPKKVSTPTAKACPKCRHFDKVYELAYDKNDLTQFKPSEMRYYCRRDKYKFK